MLHDRGSGGEPDRDEALVAGLRRSDEEAFELLVRRYGPRIRRWIACRVHDSAEVEDLTQDVLLSAWRAAPRLRSDTVLPAWLKTVAVNACRKRARRRLRKPAVPTGLAPPGTPGHDPPDIAESLDVATALRQLPEREERVLRLLYREGLSLQQTAAALDVSAEAAKSLAARARRRFRSRYTTWFGQAAGGAAILPLREVREVWSGLGSWFRSTLAASAAAAATAASLAVTVGAPQPVPPPTPSPQASGTVPVAGSQTPTAEPASAADTPLPDDQPPAGAPGAPDLPAPARSESPSVEPGAPDTGTHAVSRGDDPRSSMGTVGTDDGECREEDDADRGNSAEPCEDGDPTTPPTPPPASPGPAPGPAPGGPDPVGAPSGALP